MECGPTLRGHADISCWMGRSQRAITVGHRVRYSLRKRTICRRGCTVAPWQVIGTTQHQGEQVARCASCNGSDGMTDAGPVRQAVGIKSAQPRYDDVTQRPNSISR